MTQIIKNYQVKNDSFQFYFYVLLLIFMSIFILYTLIKEFKARDINKELDDIKKIMEMEINNEK